MERLSCKSPRLVHKELGMFLLAYNLIRALVAEAGAIHEVPVDRIRFKGTVDASRQSSIAIAPARSKKKQRELVSDWLPESLLRTPITTNSPANCGPLANPSSSKRASHFWIEGAQADHYYPWMPTQNDPSTLTMFLCPKRPSSALLAAILFTLATAVAGAQATFRERLSGLSFKIAYETYVNDNWEIFVMNADGSNPVNLTQTPKEHEHYPQVSPDGTKICFSVDQGEDRDAVRSLYVMDVDGQHRKKLVENAREPFWSPDGKVIGFLPQEYPKFNVMDYYTKGMSFYDLVTGQIEMHPNNTNIYHLYNPGFSPNGKWIVSTVHAGMGFDHTILAIERHGTNIVDLKIPGCRPCLSPDGKQLAWGSGDHEIAVAPIDLDAVVPTVGTWRLRIQDHTNETYHVDWSPDNRYLTLSRGPASKGDPSKPGTFQAACEIVGVYAPGWNLCAVSAERDGVVDLNSSNDADFVMLTTNGFSNKESAWFRPPRKTKE